MDNFASLCSSLSSRLGGLESLDQLSPPERIQLASQLESLRRQVEPPMLFWQGLIQAVRLENTTAAKHLANQIPLLSRNT